MHAIGKMAVLCFILNATTANATDLASTRLSHLPFPTSVTITKVFRLLPSRKLVDSHWLKIGRTYFQNGKDMTDRELDIQQAFCWIDLVQTPSGGHDSLTAIAPVTYKTDFFSPAFASDEGGLQALTTQFKSIGGLPSTVVGEAATLSIYDSREISLVGCIGKFVAMHQRSSEPENAPLALFATPTYGDFQNSFGSYLSLNFDTSAAEGTFTVKM